jgi:hypothetical protein
MMVGRYCGVWTTYAAGFWLKFVAKSASSVLLPKMGSSIVLKRSFIPYHSLSVVEIMFHQHQQLQHDLTL